MGDHLLEAVEARFTVPSDHPCLAGHFPGRPVVPAVVLLDEIRAAACARWGIVRLRAVSHAKFLLPVLPNQEVIVRLEPRDAGATIGFQCRTAAGTVAQGRFLVVPAP